MQGMCSEPAASFAPAALLGRGVCAIAVKAGFLHVDSATGPNQLWLDKLHLTIAPTVADAPEVSEPTLVVHEAEQLFLTNVTLNGRERNARAVYLTNEDMQAPELHMEGELPSSTLPLVLGKSAMLFNAAAVLHWHTTRSSMKACASPCGSIA